MVSQLVRRSFGTQLGLLAIIGMSAVGAVAAAAQTPTSPAPGRTVAIRDHHVHILGPDVIRDWKSLGVPFSRPDSIYLSPSTLLRVRPDTVLHVVLVPMAHLYGNSEFVGGLSISPAEARLRVRRENTHVAREAARFAGRAVALCSVPARAEWAIEELRWCADSLRVAGIKLHLASSGVDLRRPADLEAVGAIADHAARAGLPMLLHVDTQRDSLDAADVRRLADRIIAPHPTLAVVIAHLGGSGGFGTRTRTVFRALRDWRTELEAREGRTRPLFFELSAVILERESEGVTATSPQHAAMLRDDLRALRFDRMLLGSDYPVFDPVRTVELFRERLQLTDEEIAHITRGGVADPIFRSRGSPLVR